MYDFTFDGPMNRSTSGAYRSRSVDDIYKRSCIPLHLSNPNGIKTIYNMKSVFVNSTPYKNDIFSSKLSSVINAKDIGLNVDNDGNIVLMGNIHIRQGIYTKFKTKFNTINDMKKYCEFIDDLHFLQETVGHTFRCRLDKGGNVKLYTYDNKEINKENVFGFYKKSMRQCYRDLKTINRQIKKAQISRKSIEADLLKKQLDNEQMQLKIEEFVLCSNNIINALKYYYIQKDNSLYKKAKIYFNNHGDVLDVTSDGNNQTSGRLFRISGLKRIRSKFILSISKDVKALKDMLKQLQKQLRNLQDSQKKLLLQIDKVQKSHDQAVSDQKTIKYFVEKIKQNSNSIIQIMKYRKNIINDLTMCGFRIVAQ